MKKCPWCGAEYPDESTRCLVDGNLLPGSEPEAAPLLGEPTHAAPPPSPVPESPTLPVPAISSDRRLRIIELVLVSVVAFGGSILASAFYLLGWNASGSIGGSLTWANGIVHELGCLGLVWYVLARRSRTFADLGFMPAGIDVLWSILLFIGGTVSVSLVHYGIRAMGLTSVSESAASARVGQILFGGGVSAVTILFQFVNPFFEELIVRGYVMTEVKHLTQSASKAVLFSTLLQMSYHFYQGAPLAFSEGAMFALFSVYYAKTNRLTPIILAHLYLDWYGTLWYLLSSS